MSDSQCRCPQCGSSGCRVLYAVRDFEHGVPGSWDIARCGGCGLCFLCPFPTREMVPSFYPKEYSAYSGGSAIDWLFKMVYRLDARRVERVLGTSGRVLDVGCGDGSTLQALRKRGDWELFGIEIDVDAAEKARSAGFTVHQGELLDCDFEPGSFDLIRMGHVIEHVLDPAGTLRKARGLLKPGGLLVGESPNTDCWDCRLLGRYWGGWHAPRHVVLFDHRNLKQALADADFTDVRLSPRLRTVGWSAGIQNWLVDKANLKVPPSGRVRWYVLLIIPCLALTTMQAFIHWPATLAFAARKPDAG